MSSVRTISLNTPRRTAVAAVLTASLTLVAVGGTTAAALAGAPSPTAAPTGPLTSDQLKQALPSNTDMAGYTYNADEDTTTLTTEPETLTSGGPSCQKFIDAVDGLTTTYGTKAEANRTMHETSGVHTISVRVLSFADTTAAAKALTDAKDGIKGCTNIAATINDSPLVGTLAPIPQLTDATDRTGFAGFVTQGGVPLLLAGQTVQVGSTIVNILLIGPQTHDPGAQEALGTTLGQATNVVIGKMNTVTG